MKILVVDDEVVIRTLLRRLLTERGHTVKEAINLKQTLSLLADDKFDMLFTDFDLKDDHDGIYLAEHIGLIDPGIRIIVMSGSELAEERTTKERIGRFLRKPFDGSMLDSLLKKIGNH